MEELEHHGKAYYIQSLRLETTGALHSQRKPGLTYIRLYLVAL